MTDEPTIHNRIDSPQFAERLREFGKLPVVVRVNGPDGQLDFVLNTDRVKIDHKYATNTAYGDIDVLRMCVEDAGGPRKPFTADRLAAEGAKGAPTFKVKFVADEGNICFLFGCDMEVAAAEVNGKTVCLIAAIDTDDA